MKISLSPRHSPGKPFPRCHISISNSRTGWRSTRKGGQSIRLAVLYSVGLLWLGHDAANAQAPSRPLTAEMPGSAPVAALALPASPTTPGGATTAPGAVAAAPVVAKINILILAFDDVSAMPLSSTAPLPVPATVPDTTLAVPPTTTTPAAVIPPASMPPALAPPALVPPTIAPFPAGSLPLPAPAPAAWNIPRGERPLVRWQVLADKKKDKDDVLFLPIPEPSNSTIGRRSRQESAAIAAAAQAQAQGGPRTTPPSTTADLFPPSMSGLPGTVGLAPAPAGRTQQAAFSLRRALVARGWSDILTTAPDGVTVVRALGERRLAPRVLEDLKRGLAGLAVPGQIDQNALALSTLAASRVGQALGYQAVIALYVSPPMAGADTTTSKSAWNAVLVDSTRERGEPLLFDESAAVTGGNEGPLLDAGAATGAALLDKTLQNWLPPSNADKVGLATGHLAAARAALAAGDTAKAQDELNQTLALDPTRGDAYVLLGDSLKDSDPTGAAAAYRRAVEINARDGATWAKVAAAYANATPPDFPRALEAGRRALSTGYDTVDLRVAMATAQYGRATLFRNADRISQAEDAEAEAKSHLDRALALAPDDPSAVRLLATTMLAQNRFNEAIQTLDRIAPRFPNDVGIQTLYATALTNQPGREEDAFVAYSRVWKQSGQKAVNVEAPLYRSLAQGFDLRLFNLGKAATQLSAGVATGAVARESALLQLSKLKEDMNDAETAINTVQAPLSIGATTAASRVFAADLMNQSLEAHQTYLETGQPLYRARGLDLYRQAVARLNVARNTG